MSQTREDLRLRIEELAPWYQCIDLGDGLLTKDVGGGRDIFADWDIPGPLWRQILKDLPDLTGRRVLDIGCNAGYMSFEAKRLGAASVLGIDSNFGAVNSFVDQAVFCREVLDLEVEFREQSFFDLDEPPFDVVLFCGVLYHLEDWSAGLDKLASLATPGDGVVILETAIEPRTLALPGMRDYHCDTATYFVPSMSVLIELVRERGFAIESTRSLTTRGILALRAPA